MNARPPFVRPAVAAAAFLIAIAAAVSSQTAQPPTLSLLSKDGRRALPLAIVADQDSVALDDLAAAFQLTVREESLGAITVSYKGKTIVLTQDQALASVAGRLVSLPAPPSRNGRRWLVPVEFISRALSLIYDVRLDLRKPSRLLVIGDLRVPRIALRYDSLGASGRLTIDATPRATSTVSQDAEHLTIKFDADAIDAPNPPLAAPGPAGLLLGVRLVDATTLAVDLGPRVAGFKAVSQPVDATMRLAIDLTAVQSDATAPPAATPLPPPPTDLPPAFGQAGSGFRTIAIDPGHGGDDEGVKSRDGAREKDLTLAIARRVKSAIEARLGLRVLLTREDDRSVGVDERTSVANNNKADLFVSLHVNGSMRPGTSGATIYVASFDKDAAQAAGRGERVPTFGGGSREIELVPWDLAQTRHLDRSAAFADLLHQALGDRVPMAARPIDRAPLRVLESANMPAVLVELGYLTNPDQAKQLPGDAFQGAVVQALFEAIVKFREASPAGGAP